VFIEAYRWSNDSNEAEHVRILTNIFKRLPNLSALRFHTSDPVTLRNHHGGLLRPGDVDVFTDAWEARTSGSVSFRDYLYSPVGLTRLLVPVIKATKVANTSIQDLRMGDGWSNIPGEFTYIQETYGIQSDVRMLQLPLDTNGRRGHNDYRGAFELFANITHLWLSHQMVVLPSDYTKQPANLLKLLKPLNRLESLCVQVPWCYDEDDLVGLVKTHGDRLKLLALNEPIIVNGSWESAISRVLSLPLNNMSFPHFSRM
jgi:hypothetical protein